MTLPLHAAGREITLGARPWLMGIVNATPDSFSDGGRHTTLDARVDLARDLLAAGADIIDIGGESGVTNRPAVAAALEIERVVGLIERVAGGLGALVSVDTYKPAVAAAAIAAGAAIVNDVSGLRDPELADVCASTGAGLVLMHTPVPPKVKGLGVHYDDVAAEVAAFLARRIGFAVSRGVAEEQIVVDPGPDFGKTPAQTVQALRDLTPLHDLGRPVLLAISRKDFVGAITGRGPRERLAGTLAALGHGVDQGAHIFRVHDVAEAADYLAVRAVLRGERPIGDDVRLAEDLRREPAVPPGPSLR
jgi:dihydropteroate synthase